MRLQILSAACALVLLPLVSAKADIITSIAGEVEVAPIRIDLENPDAATNIDGELHVAGWHNDRAARQRIDLSTGSVQPVEYFDSFLSENGGERDPGGFIFGSEAT